MNPDDWVDTKSAIGEGVSSALGSIEETVYEIHNMLSTPPEDFARRRIVQIAAAAIPQFESAHASCFAVYALCNDGSLWTQAMAEREWIRLPEIPQERG